MFKSPFSLNGRIGRLEYAITFLAFVLAYLFLMFLSYNADEIGGVIILVTLLPTFWCLWAQGVKRCHDLGKDGWWQLIPFYIFAMFFQEGQAEPNEFGHAVKGVGGKNKILTGARS